jgi:hypothetical protein
MKAVFLMLLVVAAPGCAGARSATREIDKPERMVEAVISGVPIGTTVDEAQRFMEGEGFQCRREANTKFLDRGGLDYLYCNRYEGGIVKRRWQVAVVHRGGKVVEVLASTGLVGP